MKKTPFYSLALVIVLFSCNNDKKKSDQGKGSLELREPISTEVPTDSNDAARIPLAQGAERFKGEYQKSDMEDVKLIIGEHPTRKGFLASSLYINNKTEGALPLIYDPEKDYLTSRYVPQQPRYMIVKFQEDRLLEIHYDLNKARVDTNIYIRPPKPQ